MATLYEVTIRYRFDTSQLGPQAQSAYNQVTQVVQRAVQDQNNQARAGLRERIKAIEDANKWEVQNEKQIAAEAARIRRQKDQQIAASIKTEKAERDKQTKEAMADIKKMEAERLRIAKENEAAMGKLFKMEADARIKEGKRAADEALKILGAHQGATQQATGSTNSLTAAQIALATVVGNVVYNAFQRATSAIVAFIKNAAIHKARTDELRITLRGMAEANQISTAETARQESAIKKLGVSTQGTRQLLVTMIQAQLDLTKATKLTRAAQDLAVSGGVSTGEALQRSITAIVTGNAEMLRSLGIFVDMETQYKKVAAAQGRSVESLSINEKQQIRFNAVLEKAQVVTGNYERSMENWGKRMRSLERVWDDFQDAIASGPVSKAAGNMVDIFTTLVKIFTAFPQALAVITVLLAAFAVQVLKNTQVNSGWLYTLRQLTVSLADTTKAALGLNTALAATGSVSATAASRLGLVARAAGGIVATVARFALVLGVANALLGTLKDISSQFDKFKTETVDPDKATAQQIAARRAELEEIRKLIAEQEKSSTRGLDQFLLRRFSDLSLGLWESLPNSAQSIDRLKEKQKELAEWLEQTNKETEKQKTVMTAATVLQKKFNEALAEATKLGASYTQVLVTFEGDFKDLDDNIARAALSQADYNQKIAKLPEDVQKAIHAVNNLGIASIERFGEAQAKAAKKIEGFRINIRDLAREIARLESGEGVFLEGLITLAEQQQSNLRNFYAQQARLGRTDSPATSAEELDQQLREQARTLELISSIRGTIFDFETRELELAKSQVTYDQLRRDLAIEEVRTRDRSVLAAQRLNELGVQRLNTEKQLRAEIAAQAAERRRANELDDTGTSADIRRAYLEEIRRRQGVVGTLDQRIAELRARQLIRQGVDLVGTTPLKTADIPSAQLREIALAQAQAVRPTEQIAQNTAAIAETAKEILSAIKPNFSHAPGPAAYSSSGLPSGDVVARLMDAIIGQESTRNFRAVNPDSGALGFAQVLPGNVPSWTRQALGTALTPQQFLNDPQAQLKTIQFHVNRMYTDAIAATGGNMEEAVRRVASEWYSGRPGLLESTKPQGKYPTIHSYTHQVLQRFLGAGPQTPTTAPTAGTETVVDVEETQRRMEAGKNLLRQFRPPVPAEEDDIVRIYTSLIPEVATLIDKTKEYQALLDQDLAATLKEVNTDFYTQEAALKSLEQRYEDVKEGARTLALVRAEDNAGFFMSEAHKLDVVNRNEISRRLAIRETRDDIIRAEDDIAHAAEGAAERYHLAWVEALRDVALADQKARESQIRSMVLLDDQLVFHAEQARAIILDRFARDKGLTQIWADGLLGAADTVTTGLGNLFAKLTSKLGFFGNVVKDILSDLTRLAINHIFRSLLGAATGSGGGGGGGVMGFFGSLLGGGLRAGATPSAAGGFVQAATTVGGLSLGGGLGGGVTNAQQAAQRTIANIFSGVGFGGITAPQSNTASIQQIASIAQGNVLGGAIPGLGGGGAGGFLRSLGGLASPLATMAPVLGLALGAGLGGSSTTGSILGALGGGLAGLGILGGLSAATLGGIGGGFGASIATGLGSIFGTTSGLGGAFAGLFGGAGSLASFAAIAGPVALIAAPLIVGAMLLARNSRRRQEERVREQASRDTLPQVQALLAEAQSGNITLAEATRRYGDIRSAYFQSISGLKDKKTKRHAEQWWNNDVHPFYWPLIERAAKEGESAREFASTFVPTYALGGTVPYTGGLQTLIKVRPGERIDDVGMRRSWTVPGTDRGYDNVFTVATPGSAVRTPAQAAQVPGFANGTPMSEPEPVKVIVNKLILDLRGLVAEGMRTSDGRQAIMEVLAVEIDGLNGKAAVAAIEKAIVDRGYRAS